MGTKVWHEYETKFFKDLAKVPSSDNQTYELHAHGAEKLTGQVRLPNQQYDVIVQFFDPSFDNNIREVTVAENVSAGTWTEFNDDDNADFVRVYSPYVRVKLVNDGGSDDQPEGVAYLR